MPNCISRVERVVGRRRLSGFRNLRQYTNTQKWSKSPRRTRCLQAGKRGLSYPRSRLPSPVQTKGVRWGWGLHHRFWFLNHRGRLQQSKSNQVSEFSNRAPLASTNKKTIPRALPGHLKGVLSIFVPPASGKGQHQKDQTCT